MELDSEKNSPVKTSEEIKTDSPKLTIDTEKNQYLLNGQPLDRCTKLKFEKVGSNPAMISFEMYQQADITGFLIKKKPQKIICECGAYLGAFINHYDIACPYCGKKFTGND